MVHTATCPDNIGGFRQSGEKLKLWKYCVVMASLVLLFAEVQAQSGAWTRKPDVPTHRLGPSASVVGDRIHVIGGIGDGYVEVATNEAYDPRTDLWEGRKPRPTPAAWPSSAVVDGIIYCIGGGYPTARTNVEAYDPSSNTWTTRKDMPTARCCAQAAVVNGVIYNMGGYPNLRTCEAYDPNTNTWTAKTERPESGGVISVTVYDGIIYTFGGGSIDSWPAFPTVYAYNPQTDTWTKKRQMPTPRFALQTYLVGGKIYAIGGSNSPNVSLATVEVYDPVSDSWTQKADMPKTFSFFAGAVVNSKIYVIGGTPDWLTGGFEVWEYDPAFHTDVAAGNVSGTWTSVRSPYHVLGEITIPNESTLTIQPGVEVVFTGHYKFNVQGRLLALGTRRDSIHFTADNTAVGWHGMRFMNTPNANDSSKILYCTFKYGKANTGSGLDRCGGAILIHAFDKVLISDCLFDSNEQSGESWDPPYYEAGPAIFFIYCSPVITNSTFSNNVGHKSGAITCLNSPSAIMSNNTFTENKGIFGPIVCDFSGSPTISGNAIFHNRASNGPGGILIYKCESPTISGNIISYNTAGGIAVIYNSAPRIVNNIIVHNYDTGITCWDSSDAVLINNTIAFNNSPNRGGGLWCDVNSDPILINNILYGNSAPIGNQVCLSDTASDPHFRYCDIQGGLEAFAGSGAGANYGGTYGNNIDANPLFTDIAKDDYSLSDSSPCIGTGSFAAKVAGMYYHPPSICIMGNARPSPPSSNPDIGACENLLGSPVVGAIEELTCPIEFILYQNYPNPFNPSTTIRYELPRASHVSLTVHDLLGREIASLVNAIEQPGHKSVQWHASTVSSGLYFYRLRASDFVAAKKMMLVK